LNNNGCRLARGSQLAEKYRGKMDTWQPATLVGSAQDFWGLPDFVNVFCGSVKGVLGGIIVPHILLPLLFPLQRFMCYLAAMTRTRKIMKYPLMLPAIRKAG